MLDASTIAVVIVISLAFLGESIFGFGGGLIAVPLTSLMLGVRDAVTLVLVFQLLMGLLVFQNYKQTDWNIAFRMTAGLIIGTVTGTLLLSKSTSTFLELFLAVSILAFLARMIFIGGFKLNSTRNIRYETLTGLGGGLFQGLIGTGGPVLTMYLSVVIPKKIMLRATLIYLFFIGSIVRVGISIPQHLFTTHIMKMALVSLPAFLVAILIGQSIHHKVDEIYYWRAIYSILFISSILMLIKALANL